MVIVRARLVGQHQVISYYDTVLYSNSRVLYSTVKKKKKKKWQTCHRVLRCSPHSTVCRSPGQGIGRPGLMVTSHCADRISGRWVTFLTLHNRSRCHFRFRKRMWRHPRWRTEAEMAPAPVMERWESYLHYWRPRGPKYTCQFLHKNGFQQDVHKRTQFNGIIQSMCDSKISHIW